MQRNLTELMKDIEILYEQALDEVEINDEDGATRLMLLNQGILRWAKYQTTRWNELTDVSEISEIEIGKANYDFPVANFRLIDSVSDESGEIIPVKSLAAATKIGKYVVITGNPNIGYKINLGWQPAENDKLIGQKLRVVSQRKPQLFTAEDMSSDKVAEMSDDNFLVKYVVAELYASDEPALFNKYMQDAMTDLDNMRDQNEAVSAGSAENWAEEQEGLGY